MIEQPPPRPNAVGAALTRPDSLRNAVWLMYLGAVLQVAFGVAFFMIVGGLGDDDAVRAEFARRAGDDAQALVDNAVTAWRIGIGAGTLLLTALWLLLAWANGQGRAWGRVAATLTGIAAIALSVFVLLNGFNAVVLITLLLAVTILYFLYRPDATEFYDAVAARHTGTGPPVA
ncbi:hypothetical protein C6V83_02850 [Gordonia iterans]|uniref:DUF2127 domain-containing protein n=1 Tax=Gordonia iterans TaxID=1004901 RepID=A0A2S0KCG6_9ACTN|nr:hypothetical protein [Gordonia iterans]AVL99382.1 hypothetical protein C6V83_02850 [Gordonia iterans]